MAAAEARAELEAQLSQVQARLADALKDRETAQRRGCTQTTWAILNQRLHTLYALEYDVKRDLAALALEAA
jgi:hypothetical protein